MRILLCVLLTGISWGEEVKVDGLGTSIYAPVESEQGVPLSLEWDLSPKECSSGLYRFDGKMLRCQRADLLDFARAHRDYFQAAALEWKTRADACTNQIKTIESANVVGQLLENHQEGCRQQGKGFDPILVRCSGTIGSSSEETK